MGLLRFLFAIIVVMAHSGPILGNKFIDGRIAVQAFYIISGFYMALILNEKYIGINDSYKLFITNRLLRLYPVYWTILLCSVLFSVVIFIHSHGHKASLLQPYFDYFKILNFSSFCFLLFTNLFLFFQDVVLFLGIDQLTGNLYFTSNFYKSDPYLYKFLLIPQAWTIGLELTFYLIVPFFARKNVKFIIFLITLSVSLRIILIHSGLQLDPWSYRFFPTELVFFLSGIISYKIYSILQKAEIKVLYLKTIWGCMIAFTLLFEFIKIPYKDYIYLFTLSLTLPFVFILTNKWKHDVYVGNLSYPIYLSHIFVLACLTSLKIPMAGWAGLSLTIWTIVFSIVLNELVAKRIDRIRQQRIKRTT